MAYSGVVAADSPVLWYRLNEAGGSSRNQGSDAADLYAYGVMPTVGFTGIASDGGSVALIGGASMDAYPVTTIAANSGFSLEAWIYVQGETPFNPSTADYPVQLFIDSAAGFQLGMVPSSRLATVRDTSDHTKGATASSAAAFGWHHLCATREAGATPPIHLYVDGTLVGSSAAFSGFGVIEPVWLHLIAVPTPVSLFVAEPAAYYTELSATRVAAHAAAADMTAAPRYIARMPGVCS